MTTASTEALQALRTVRHDVERRVASFDVHRFKPQFESLKSDEAREVEQEVILELHKTLKLLRQEIYPDSARKSLAEALLYFTRLYDWGHDERLIDQTLAWGMEAWGYERVFKSAIRTSMAALAPEEHQRLFSYKSIGQQARAAENAKAVRLWRRIGWGMVAVLLGIAYLAKQLSF
jgi:hypothetical protein